MRIKQALFEKYLPFFVQKVEFIMEILILKMKKILSEK